MSARDVDTIRTAYEEFAAHDAAAVLSKLDPGVECVEGGGGDSPSGMFEHVFDMRDGKVVRFENKPDDAEAWIAGWTS